MLLGGFSSTERRFIYQQHSLIRKSCYDEVGQFDEMLVRSQDFEMLVRLAHRFAAVKVDGVAFHLREHSGTRGSGASYIPADRVVEAWLKNDQKLFSRIYETYDLRDFGPRKAPLPQLSDQPKFAALLQRACIMARKGVWEKASLNLQLAGEIAQRTQRRTLTQDEAIILRRFFDLSSFAPYTFDSAEDFRRALNGIKPAQVQRKIRAAILWPLPLTIGAVLVNRQYTNFWRFLRVYFALATTGAVLRTLFSPSLFSAGLGLIRNRLSSGSARAKERPQSTSIPAG